MERAGDGAALARGASATALRFCVRCRAALGERYWIIAFPDGAHEHCVDWSGKPFPFARHLEVLGLLARRSRPPHQAALLDARAALWVLHAHWPEDPLAILDEGRAIVGAARAHVADLDHRDRQRL